MSGEWLKFDKATPDKPEVFGIASELGIDPDAVVGKLMRVWSWFDTHTEFGNAASVTSALLDRIAGVTGFVSAMQKVGWIEPFEQGLRLPKFDRHCGETAKKRAQNNKRVNDFRARNAPSVTDACTREEKRREDKKEQKQERVQPAAARFDEFWNQYPNKKGRADALKTWKRKGLDARADDLIAHVRQMLLTDDGWRRGFVPMGSTYLNGDRWEDEPRIAPADPPTPRPGEPRGGGSTPDTRKPTQTPLQNHLAWLGDQVRRGAMTEDQAKADADRVRAKYATEAA